MKSKLMIVILCCVATSSAQISNVQVTAVTAVQAVIAYTAPDSGACTLAVSENASLSPVVADVNPNLFAGANSDARFAFLNQGATARTFVIGTVPKPSGLIQNQAVDGNYYGRALKPYTPHWFQIQCGGATAGGTFTTANLALGKTYGEPEPIAGPGVWAFPTLFGSNFNWSTAGGANPRITNDLFRDPVLGTLMRPLSVPGLENINDRANIGFTTVTACANWTNPPGLNSMVSFATYNGTGQDKCGVGGSGYGPGSSWVPDAVRFSIKASTSGTSGMLDACVTLDGATCWGPTQQYALTGTLQTLSIPAGTARPNPFADGWTTPLKRLEGNGQGFNGGTNSAAGIYGNPKFGVLLWKDATSNSDTISIQNVRAAVYNSRQVSFYSGGEEWACNLNQITAQDGSIGYLCSEPMAGATSFVYYIVSATGEARFLGLFSGTITFAGVTGHSACFFGGNGGTAMWDATANNAYWGLCADSARNIHLIKTVFPPSGSSFYNRSVGVNALVTAYGGAVMNDMSPVPNTLATQFAKFISACTGANCPPAFSGSLAFGGWFQGGMNGKYLTGNIYSYQQNSPSWLFAIDTTAPPGSQIVGGTSGWNQPNMNWSGFHAAHPTGTTTPPVFVFVNHFLQGGGTTGPYTTTLTNAIGSTDTNIVVGGTPVSTAPGAIPGLSTWQVGDIVQVGSEFMQITALADQQHLSVTRASSRLGTNSWLITCLNGTLASAHSAGTTVMAFSIDGTCGSNASGIKGPQSGSAPIWWEFLSDPYGQKRLFPNQLPNPSGQNSPFFIEQDSISSHMGYSAAVGGNSASEAGNWSICANQPPATNCQMGGTNLAGTANGSPNFAGVTNTIAGNAWDKHPTAVHQMSGPASEQVWGSDIAVMFGDLSQNGSSWTNVSGQIWVMTPNASWTGTKKLATVAVNGVYPVVDISGPSGCPGANCIDSSASYSYCYVYKAGECHAGSLANRVYVNIPTGSLIAAGATCTDGISHVAPRPPFASDNMCFTNWTAYGGQIAQFNLTAHDPAGANLRAISQLMTPVQSQGGAVNAQPTPDGQWIMFSTGDFAGRPYTFILNAGATALPFPATSIAGNDFVKKTIAVNGGAAGASNVVIEFGYDSSFNCTSRNDPCVTNWSTSFSDVAAHCASTNAGPFCFEAGDGPLASIPGVACATLCNVIVPVLPGHVAFYDIVYRDASNNVLSRSGVNTVIGQ